LSFLLRKRLQPTEFSHNIAGTAAGDATDHGKKVEVKTRRVWGWMGNKLLTVTRANVINVKTSDNSLKIFGTLWLYAHGYFSQNFSWTLVLIGPMNVRTKFKVRNFTRSWDNRGTQKFGQSLNMPKLPFLRIFNERQFGCIL